MARERLLPPLLTFNALCTAACVSRLSLLLFSGFRISGLSSPVVSVLPEGTFRGRLGRPSFLDLAIGKVESSSKAS